MANLLWSYATLGHYPGDQLLEAMALHMVDRIQAYRPQAVSNTLWAYAKVPPLGCLVPLAVDGPQKASTQNISTLHLRQGRLDAFGVLTS